MAVVLYRVEVGWGWFVLEGARWSAVASAVATGILACGPSQAPEPAELAALCGATAPVQLLPLGSDDGVTPSPHAIVRHGDRWLIGVHSESGEGRSSHTERIISTDACGDDARVVVEGYDLVMAPPRAGLPWFACRHVGSIGEAMVWFDPDGIASPRALGNDACELVWVGDEVVFAATSGGAPRELVVARLDEAGDLVQQQVLAEDVGDWTPRTKIQHQRHTSYRTLESPRVASEPTGHLYAVTATHELLDIDVPARDVTVVGAYSGVNGSIAADDRLVAMRGTSAFVLDLEHGVEVEYATVQSGLDGGPYLGSGTVTVTRNSIADGNTYAVTLDDMLDHVLTGSLLHPVGRGDDGTVYFFGSEGDDRGVLTWRPDPSIWRVESPDFLAGPALSAWQAGELFAVVRWTANLTEDEPEYDLVRFDGPALHAEVLLRDVYDPLPLPGGRWISVREDEETSGALTVLTPGFDVGTIVDEEVDRDFAALQGGPARVVTEDTDATVIYMVARGERRGVWLLALEPGG